MSDGEIGDPHLTQSGVTSLPLVREGFHSIEDIKSARKLAFVDGGNQEIIGAPNFSVQLNRIYSMLWRNNVRQTWKLPRVEFFSSTLSCFKENEIYYETTIVPSTQGTDRFLPDSRDLSFSSMERSLMNGNQRADISRVGSVARRFAEWRLALSMLDELSDGDILVTDGTLQSNFKHEAKYVQALSSKAIEKGVVLTGVSKTSTVFTTTGLSLLGAVNTLAKKEGLSGNWYLPVAESTSADHNVMVTIAKLNPATDWVFRIEIQRDQYNEIGDKIEEIFSIFCQNSCDPTFPGYPYGLIDADRFARVSFDEVAYYRGLIVSEISKLGKASKFLPHIRSGDAHDILNLLVK